MNYMRLIDVCDFQGGSQPPKDEWSFKKQDGYIRMLQIRDFTQSERVTPEYIKISNSIKICDEDDILIARYGASIGKILTGLAGAYNVAIMRTIPDTSKIKKRYLYYYLKSNYFQNAILNVGSRAAQAGFNKEDLGKLEINCPLLSKQEEIINILYRIETIIEKRKLELLHLDELIKARFVEMFGDVSRNPNVYPLFEIGELIRSCEAGWSGNGTQRERKENEIAVLKVSSVTKGYFIPEECKVLDDQENIKKYVSPQKGDLIFSRANTREMVGATAVILEDYPRLILPDKLWKIKFTDNINVFYMKYILSSKCIREQFSAVSTGTSGSMFNVSMEKFKKIKVPVAPLDTQNEFRKFVHQVDKLKLPVSYKEKFRVIYPREVIA